MNFFIMRIMMSATIFLLLAVFFFVIGGTVLIRKKPLILSSRWLFSFMVLWFTSLIVEQIVYSLQSIFLLFSEWNFNIVNVEMILFTYIIENWITVLLMLLIPLMYLFVLIVFWFQTQGYTLYGITDETVRNALHYGLQELKSPYEEMLTKIKLSELDTELQISLQSWMGTGLIKIKDRSKRAFLTKLAQHMRIYFKEHDIATKNTAAIFCLIIGGFMTLLAIVPFKMVTRLI